MAVDDSSTCSATNVAYGRACATMEGNRQRAETIPSEREGNVRSRFGEGM
jgi:hypothetical protein